MDLLGDWCPWKLKLVTSVESVKHSFRSLIRSGQNEMAIESQYVEGDRNLLGKNKFINLLVSPNEIIISDLISIGVSRRKTEQERIFKICTRSEIYIFRSFHDLAGKFTPRSNSGTIKHEYPWHERQ
jgi:hypothetical protein